MNTKVVKVFLLAMMVMVALLSINTTLGAQPGNQGGGMVAVSTENEKQERNDDTNAEILTDTREHFHESGLSAAMVDALRNLDDNHQSQSNDGTTTQTIDFSNIGDISEERLAEVREVFDWLDEQMLELDESRAVERILKRIKTYLFVKDNENEKLQQTIKTKENTEIDESEESPYNSTYLASDLELLQDFLHQIDNAQNFLYMNGIETLMSVFSSYSNQGSIIANGINENVSELERVEIIENCLSLLGILSNNNEDIINYINKMPLTKQFPDFNIRKNNNNNNNNDDNKNETHTRAVNDNSNRKLIHHPIITVLELLDDEISSNFEISSKFKGRYYVSKLIYALSAMIRQNSNGLHMMQNYKVSNILEKLFDSLLLLENENNGQSSHKFVSQSLLKIFRLIDDIISLNDINLDILKLSEENEFCKIMKHGLTMQTNDSFFDYFEHRRATLEYFQNIFLRESIQIENDVTMAANQCSIEDNQIIIEYLAQIKKYIAAHLNNGRTGDGIEYDQFDIEMMYQQKNLAQKIIDGIKQSVQTPQKIEL